MNRLDGLVEYYQAWTLPISLTQHVVHTIGYQTLLRIRFSLIDVIAQLHKRFESASPQFVSGDCPLIVRYLR
jgi:hypothetical protein